MNIIFKTAKLQKLANTRNSARRKLGAQGGDRFLQRLEEFRSSDSLAILMQLPNARCHPLVGNHKGKFAVDLDHPYRLLFEPANNPLPKLEDGSLDLGQITSVQILAIEDYHG